MTLPGVGQSAAGVPARPAVCATLTLLVLLAVPYAGFAAAPASRAPVALPLPQTATTIALAPATLPAPATPSASLPATATATSADNPAWIQWLGFSSDGQRVAWRQGPHWTTILTGSPIEIARLDKSGRVVAHIHQTSLPSEALKQRRIRLTPQVRWQRKGPRDMLLESSDGRVFAVVVRPGKPGVAALLEKRRGSYDPLLRWSLRGPAARLDVVAYEDWSHRWLAVVVHADNEELADAQVVLVPLARGVRAKPTLLVDLPLPPSP